jgi:hypothetical protein
VEDRAGRLLPQPSARRRGELHTHERRPLSLREPGDRLLLRARRQVPLSPRSDWMRGRFGLQSRIFVQSVQRGLLRLSEGQTVVREPGRAVSSIGAS